MAKFSRFLAGGIVGAGVALLLSPKTGREIRRLLLGAGRKALPPSPEHAAAPRYEPAAPAAAAAGGVSEVAAREELEEIPAPAPSPAVTAEAPAVTAGMQFPAEEAEETEAEMMIPGEEAEEAPAAIDAETAEFMAFGGETMEQAGAVEEEPVAENPAAAPAEESWEILKTPVWGEPTLETEPAGEAAGPVSEPPQAMEPPVETGPETEPAAGPAQAPAAPSWAEEFMAGETPLTQEPAAEEGAGAEPAAAEKPVAEEPVAEAAQQPAPAGIDPDEMRRRIDETRNRLKAKSLETPGGKEKPPAAEEKKETEEEGGTFWQKY